MGRPVIHFEIGCRDKERTKAFFSELFGWGVSDMGPATMIDTQAAGAGIPGHMTALGHEPHNYTIFCWTWTTCPSPWQRPSRSAARPWSRP